jgi:drug/metabolite transporter (DMT)-like permease
MKSVLYTSGAILIALGLVLLGIPGQYYNENAITETTLHTRYIIDMLVVLCGVVMFVGGAIVGALVNVEYATRQRQIAATATAITDTIAVIAGSPS